MCGITGIYNTDAEPVSESLLTAMTDVIAHRGPDDSGIFLDNNVGLGHRRLSIIDLSPDGHQPMCNEDGTVWITYNGEIYNFKEIREYLLSKGHSFKSKTDTEVIIHLYEEIGEDCLDKLTGMFAFVIWDQRKQRLFAARDRLGIKPLYYYHKNGILILASEIKSILQHPIVERQVNHQSLYNHLNCRFSVSPHTIFKDIIKLAPGYMLTCHGSNVSTKQYWDIQISQDNVAVESRIYSEKLFTNLSQAVSSQMISDAPVGAFLSGGVDSSTVVAMMSTQSSNAVKTFTVGFNDASELSELDYAKSVSSHLNTQHKELMCSACTPELLKKIIWHIEEPIGDPAIIPTYLVAGLASKDVKVVLTGEGSDEANGGYEKYLTNYKYSKLFSFFSKVPWPIRKLMLSNVVFKRNKVISRFNSLNTNRPIYEENILSWLSYDFWCGVEKNNFLTSNFKGELCDDSHPFHNILDSLHVDRDNRFFVLDIKTWLSDDLLLKVDKMTMAHSLEARVPYLDHKYLEYALTIPSKFKFKGGETKYIFRKASGQILPQSIAKRRQHGFIVPLHLWLNRDLKNYTLDVLNDPRTHQRGYFNKSEINKMLELHFSQSYNYASQLWQLLLIELWHRVFIDSI